MVVHFFFLMSDANDITNFTLSLQTNMSPIIEK